MRILVKQDKVDEAGNFIDSKLKNFAKYLGEISTNRYLKTESIEDDYFHPSFDKLSEILSIAEELGSDELKAKIRSYLSEFINDRATLNNLHHDSGSISLHRISKLRPLLEKWNIAAPRSLEHLEGLLIARELTQLEFKRVEYAAKLMADGHGSTEANQLLLELRIKVERESENIPTNPSEVLQGHLDKARKQD